MCIRDRWGWLAGAALVVFVGELMLGSGIVRSSYDASFRWMRPHVPQDLVIVYVDTQVKSRLQQPADQPLDRRFYTRLLERLQREKARLVLFDILFDSPQADATDNDFAEAMRKHGKVVLVGD